MKKLIVGISLFVISFIIWAIAGQLGRNFAKKTIEKTMVSKEIIAIKRIADQYSEASKKMTAAINELSKADQKIKSSVQQLERLKTLLIECEAELENYENIRKRGHKFLISNKKAFEKEFFENMLFTFDDQSTKQCSHAFLEFILNYKETIEYLILNFDKIVSSNEPELSIYNKKFQNSNILRKKYNEAYVKKINVVRARYGEEETKNIMEKLN